MAAPRNFIVLSDRNMAITNNATGVARKPFKQSDLNATRKTTVSFETDSPCVAIMDNDGVQWDLDSKRVWYKDGWVTIDLVDILNSKNMINAESTITVGSNKVYTRYRAGDTASGYCWMNASLSPKKLYTRTEYPVVNTDYAYETGKIPTPEEEGNIAKQLVKGWTAVDVDPIEGIWEALFAISVVSGGTGCTCGLEFTILDD